MKIPVINYWDAEVREKFIDSIKKTGFAVLSQTPVPQSRIDSTYLDYKEFFNRSQDKKNKLLFNKEDQDGYFPMKSEKAKDASVFDIKEFFHHYPNRGNSRVVGANTSLLCLQLEDLAIELLGWLNEDYLRQTEVDKTEFAASQDWAQAVEGSKATLFRVIHYPPLTGNEEAGAVRAAAHEDINFITLLPAATDAGLQVKDLAGNWHDVGTDENSIIVNVGDMLQELTGGYYPSTTHRVVNPTGENKVRYSMPLFLHPKPETRLSARYTAHEYLMERLRELGLL